MLDVASRSDGDNLVLIWAESGGPQIAGPPPQTGFGTNFVAQTVARQFKGVLDYDWQPSGLVARLQMRNDLLRT